MSRLLVRCFQGLFLACLLTIAPAVGAGNVDAARAFTLADVDLQRSVIINKGQREPLTVAA
ncbi:MAG: hypothetical protein JWN70_6357, partial [Planctomycetaceae bacterium]|nr:hypothetical protein [Planctomycetaceae bacterium]